MASVLRVKDKDGNELEIPAVRGRKGERGDKGKSAYEIVKEYGYEGSEQEWAESMQRAVDSAAARPAETKVFLNDYSYEAGMDMSSFANSCIVIRALADETNSFANKKIEKIEYSFDGGESWIDVRDFIQTDLFNPYTVNINRSFAYNDGDYDTVCFGVLCIVRGSFSYAEQIQLGNQHGFRVTFCED